MAKPVLCWTVLWWSSCVPNILTYHFIFCLDKPGKICLDILIIVMPPPNGLEAYMFLSCPYFCQSGTFFPHAITKEPLDGISKNCRTAISTLKWRAELFFRGRGIQDGCLRVRFLWNIHWSFSLDWIEILTSINFFVTEVTLKKGKVLKIVKNYRKLPKTAKNNLHWSINLYWIEILTSFFLLDSRTYHKTLEIAENCWKLQKTARNCRKQSEKAITLYWIEILTSIFCWFPELHSKHQRLPQIAKNFQKLPKTARNHWKRPNISGNYHNFVME